MTKPNDSTSEPTGVLVTGDVVTDHYIYHGQQHRSGSTSRLGTVERTDAGGAALLHDLLQEVAHRQPGLSVVSGFDLARVGRSAPAGYCVMRPFPKEPRREERVWRMAEPLGFSSVDIDLDLTAVNETALLQDHRIVVLDDAGLSFRRWPAQAAWPRFLLDSSRPLPDWLVVKISGPVASGDLWHTLVSGESQDVPARSVRKSAELLNRVIVVISINDLRVEPIHVSKNLSWERAALDLLQELGDNRCLAGLRSARFVIVSLGSDGALLAEFAPDGGVTARLVFDPARLEGDFEAHLDGGLIGYQTCLVAAITSRLARGPGSEVLRALEEGVRAGLAAKRRLLLEGHGPVPAGPGTSLPGFPHGKLADEILASGHAWSYGSIPVPRRPRSDPWTIIGGGASGVNPAPLWGLARRVARRGVQQLKQTPYLQFGNLFSIERTEIESLRTLQRLLRSYRDDRKATKPLCVAAFGPPGSGKSFGVKQLAKAVFSDDQPPLEFNLSQFQDPSQLHGLLHQVRDQVLLGRLPVVFWDEFDSQELRWLQYLLAPMQDGTFQEGPITHPIGKSVFVFAGGTRSRFEDFGNPPASFEPADPSDRGRAKREREGRERWEADFRAKKGPDFKSRLAGYINVLGPNPRDGDDITYPVRRALLLRVHLGASAEKSLTIESGLLAAFLKIDEYRHGARSLEKIAEQVRLNSRTGEFTRSDLPSRSELDLHVDAERFLKLVELET